MKDLFANIYNNRTVLITGHTGFKGSWLAYWLTKLGANVVGYSLEAPTNPSHFELLNISMKSIIGDIRDKENLIKQFERVKPDIVFHLAAQPLVRLSYENPVETFETNIQGTINVLEACRKIRSIKAIVNVTSDKCYENKEWIWGYRENDSMGGYDPYSASKGCSELITASYRNSFFNKDKYNLLHNTLLASARAGNVIGGGDWAKDRLIPDVIKATINSEKVFIRNPLATRPWQHVLEPLSGYLTLGWRLLEGQKDFSSGFNFGPNMMSNISVKDVVERSKTNWEKIQFILNDKKDDLHEANLLMLDCSKAQKLLKWEPVWSLNETFERTIQWYRAYYEEGLLKTKDDLENYVNVAREKELIWTK